MEKTKKHTSSEVKDRYNRKAYDQLGIRVKKGYKEDIAKKAVDLGISTNALAVAAIDLAVCEKVKENQGWALLKRPNGTFIVYDGYKLMLESNGDVDVKELIDIVNSHVIIV